METLTIHPVEELEQAAASWNNITVESHRFGGRAFKLNGTEIGHIHFNGMLDIPFSKAIRDVLLKMNLVKPHHYLPETGWISYHMKHNAASINQGMRLLRLSYLFRTKRMGIADEGFEDEVAQLNFGKEITDLLIRSQYSVFQSSRTPK